MLRLTLMLALLVSLFTPLFSGQVVEAASQTTTKPYTEFATTKPHFSGSLFQSAELTATDSGSAFGNAVSLSGDGNIALVGGTNFGGARGTGAAFIYNNNGGTWSLAQEITATDATLEASFGNSVSLSGDGHTALIGAAGEYTNTGEVYVFSNNGGQWQQIAEFTGSDSTTYCSFGLDVSLSSDGHTALVSAYKPSNGGPAELGVAYIFSNNSGSWKQITEITLPDNSRLYALNNSASLSGDGHTAIIGGYDVNFVGRDYIYTDQNGNWQLSGELTPADPSKVITFGSAVSLSGDGSLALIGAQYTNSLGTTYLYSNKGGNWQQINELTANDLTVTANGTNAFGNAVSLSKDGHTALIGDWVQNQNTGAAYTFSDSNGSWKQTGKLVASDGTTNASFGEFVSLSSDGKTALLGAAGQKINGISDVGAAYIFTPSSTLCQPASGTTPTAPITATNTYYLPFLACDASNYTTYLAFQNTTSTPATVTLQYFNAAGTAVATPSTTCGSVAAFAECIAPNPFSDGQQGTGIIYSSQPLNVIVSEATPYGGSAYAVAQGASNNQIAPVIIRGGLGDFTTNLTIFNGGNSSVAGTVQFYQEDGTLVSAATKNFTLNGDTSISYDQASDTSLGSNFYGWAQISSPSGSQLVAQVLEQSPSQHFVALANAQATAQSTLYAPAIFRNAYGAFNTGVNIVNPNAQAVNVTVTYYNKDGSTYAAPSFSLAAHGVQPIFQGGANGIGLPSGGLIDQFGGAAIVTATNGGVVMVVNEFGGVNANGNAKSGTYSASASSSDSVGLPVIANGGFGYTTGTTIFNTSNQTINGSIQYYNTDGSTQGTAKTFSVGAHQSQPLFQGDSSQSLSSSFYGTAVVTESGGGKDLIITTNAASSAFFYSYTEPNS